MMEYTGDLAKAVEAVRKLQPKVKMQRVKGRRGEYLYTCGHTPEKLDYDQAVTLDSTGFLFVIVHSGYNRQVRVEWPENSEFWEYGTQATVPTFLLARILKNPKHPYAVFAGVNEELRIREEYGEFRLTTFPGLEYAVEPDVVFNLREFERMSPDNIQATIEGRIGQ